MFSYGYALLGGVAGGLVFLMVILAGRAMGMTKMNFLHMLGTMFTPRISRKGAYTLGFMIHMMMSAGFGLLHARIIESIGIKTVGASAAWGLGLGAIHGVAILMVMPMVLSMMHPLVRSGEMEKPGIALTGYGSMTPVGSLMAHVAFGVVIASVYAAGVLK